MTLLLVGCGGAATPTPTDAAPAPATSAPETTAPATPAPTPSPSPSPSATPIAMPTDCRAILSPAVLEYLGDTPLNHEAFGESGTLPEGALRCVWADPRADTTGLVTDISRMRRGPALDLLNALADDEGFLCYTPDEGTRCEKTWPNEMYPVTDGRTLYWRDDILIDTRYSNLAPPGYTASIVARVFG